MTPLQPADATEIRTDSFYSQTVDQDHVVLRLGMMAGQAVVVRNELASADLTFEGLVEESEEFSLRDVAVSDAEILAWGDALPTYEGADDMVDLDI